MDGNQDLVAGQSERESLPAHVDACSRRYVILRGEIGAVRERTDKLYRLAIAILLLVALGALEGIVPGSKGAVVAMLGKLFVGGG